ncbi:MAG: hypothetical protein KJ718_03530 [Nanoarchaeota archaeon]|nr:hypothetical protein [Nanoarchaeota archaeon]MBU1051601.1 hypothetical protein [Nanoarchaeota archaeon]MBU1988037.1 hypothetical protein [Nanoarchaeota archaeon]
MQKELEEYLDKHNIKYKEYKHEAVFTVEQSLRVKDSLPQDVFHTKNLFLKDESKKFFLVCMHAYSLLNLKSLKELLHAKKKLSFASAEQLKSHLNLMPGSVSIFGMMFPSSSKVTLIIDKKIFSAKKVGFHPNINTATLVLDHTNFEKFLNTLDCEKQALDLENEN